MSKIEQGKKYNLDQLRNSLNKVKNAKQRLAVLTRAQNENNAADKAALDFLAQESLRLTALIEVNGDDFNPSDCLTNMEGAMNSVREKREKANQARADEELARRLAAEQAERELAANVEKDRIAEEERRNLGRPGSRPLSGARKDASRDDDNEDQVTQEELAAFADSLADGFNEADFADFVIEVEFQGFDPKRLLGYMKKKEPSEDTLKDDAKKLILLTLIRGTNFTKSLKSMSKAGARECQRLINKYTVKQNTKNDRHALTLSRIVCAFPLMAANFRSKGMGRVVGQPGELPLYLQFNGSPALMVGAEMEKVFQHYLLWQVSFSTVVNKGRFNTTQIINFATVQRTSSYYNSAKCLEFLERYNARLEEINEVPADRQLKPEPMRPVVRSRREDEEEM